MLVGFVNGLLIAKVGIPSFIATLGTQFFWAGMAAVLSGGKSYALRGAEETLGLAGASSGGPFAGPGSPDWLEPAADPGRCGRRASCVVLWFILNRHRFGEHMLFIGDSNAVSRVVGIDVDREKIKLFTLMGALAAVAAIMLTLENKNYFGNQGQGYLLDRHRLGADRRHLDLRRPRDDRRHGLRLLHHRHDASRAWWRRA